MNTVNVYLRVAIIHFNLPISTPIGLCAGIMGGFFGQSLSAIRRQQKIGNVD